MHPSLAPAPASDQASPQGSADAVALIEVGQSHDECLYAQIRFLHAYGTKVHLIVSHGLHQRRLLPTHGADGLEVLPATHGPLASWRSALLIAAYLKRHHLRQAVVNTAQGKIIRNLCLIAPRRAELCGVVHNAQKLVQRSLTQGLISRKIKKYLVLNDYIRDELRRLRPHLQVASFYPIFFPVAPRPIPPQPHFLVAIPGQLQYARRDYAGLISALARGPLDPRLRFVLLGNASGFDGPDILRRLRDARLLHLFQCFDQFIDYPTLLGHLAACDLVLPLLNPGMASFDNYLRFKITGGFTLAQAARRPLLLHEAFAQAEDFQLGAVFHSDANFIERLNQLARQPAELHAVRTRLAACRKFDFDYQARSFVGFLQPQRLTPGPPPAQGGHPPAIPVVNAQPQ